MVTEQLIRREEIVKKSNALARARWSPDSVWEPRLVAWLASKIRVTDTDFQTYKIRIVELVGNEPGGRDYKDLEHAIFKAMGRVIVIKDNNTSSMYNLFAKCKIDRKNGTIEVCFHPDLKEHYLQLGSFFTKYNLFEFMKLPSIYSQRIFEFLKSWDDKKEIIVKLSELHDMLETPKSFRANFAEFKRKVIEKAHRDILKYTELKYSWEPIKYGRAVYEIKFSFYNNINKITKKDNKKHNQCKENNGTRYYSEFISKFSDSLDARVEAGKIWFALREKNVAPLAEDVPNNNTLSLMEFLQSWQDKHECL